MSKFGLSTLHTTDKPEVDIVFVHGLRGHREKTWMKNGYLWPRDFLATDLENCRIISFGYDSDIVHSDTAEVTQGSLESDARSLCALLSAERSLPDSRDRPIIFVAHSLGGLVCAEAIILGERNAIGDSVQTIAEHVNGIVFLGTPFAGSNLAKWGDLVRAIFSVVRKTDQTTLKTLKENSHDLKELGTTFPETVRKRNTTAKKIQIVFFYETLPTYGVIVVEEKSASYPGIGETIPIRCNHLDICKFGSNNDDGYKVVKAKIIEIVRGHKEKDHKESGDTVFHNYDKVINQAGRDMNIGNQSFQF